MIKNIKMTKTDMFINTDGNWETDYTEERTVDEQWYNNVIKAKGFFESIGGKEDYTKKKTDFGMKVIKVISTSPDRQEKSVWEFNFDEATED